MVPLQCSLMNTMLCLVFLCPPSLTAIPGLFRCFHLFFLMMLLAHTKWL